MRRRNPRYAPEALERRLCPSPLVADVTVMARDEPTFPPYDPSFPGLPGAPHPYPPTPAPGGPSEPC